MSSLKPHRATQRATDKQIGGNHYKSFAIAPIEFITKNKLSFIQGCIVKYICRYDKKNGKEDLDKIIHYCELLKELE
ncbi:MAG TPA: DUF3310 domain-containing protein [Thermodesulfobacteriota bacterium]|nr:DUF3310 domain-containing protein [Thermodesulfobacteriota bacterium]